MARKTEEVEDLSTKIVREHRELHKRREELRRKGFPNAVPSFGTSTAVLKQTQEGKDNE